MPIEPKNVEYDTSYSKFIFSELAKGPHVGDLLHKIFEYIDFSEDTNWDVIVNNSLKHLLPEQAENENHKTCLVHMINEVVNSSIIIDNKTFSLSDIDNTKKKSEIEFDFTVNKFNTDRLSELNKLMPEGYSIDYKNYDEVEGILNGFIDLFFEHDGKYYILDWKSNYLGNTIEDYNKNNIVDMMNRSNYHLQYLIYTLAIKKYLSSKIHDFNYDEHFGGVIYLFIRGVRKGSADSIFTYKPKIELIKKLDEIFSSDKEEELIGESVISCKEVVVETVKQKNDDIDADLGLEECYKGKGASENSSEEEKGINKSSNNKEKEQIVMDTKEYFKTEEFKELLDNSVKKHLNKFSTHDSVAYEGNLKNDILHFIKEIEKGNVEIYNEFSLQHELGCFLRKDNRIVQFERNVSHFGLDKKNYVKKEIDIVVINSNTEQNNNIIGVEALELKMPLNGQCPEEMFSFIKDIKFLEEISSNSKKTNYFLAITDDKLFWDREIKNDGIYSYFRNEPNIINAREKIYKPTGEGKDEIFYSLENKYLYSWLSIKNTNYKYLLIDIPTPRNTKSSNSDESNINEEEEISENNEKSTNKDNNKSTKDKGSKEEQKKSENTSPKHNDKQDLSLIEVEGEDGEEFEMDGNRYKILDQKNNYHLYNLDTGDKEVAIRKIKDYLESKNISFKEGDNTHALARELIKYLKNKNV